MNTNKFRFIFDKIKHKKFDIKIHVSNSGLSKEFLALEKRLRNRMEDFGDPKGINYSLRKALTYRPVDLTVTL